MLTGARRLAAVRFPFFTRRARFLRSAPPAYGFHENCKNENFSRRVRFSSRSPAVRFPADPFLHTKRAPALKGLFYFLSRRTEPARASAGTERIRRPFRMGFIKIVKSAAPAGLHENLTERPPAQAAGRTKKGLRRGGLSFIPWEIRTCSSVRCRTYPQNRCRRHSLRRSSSSRRGRCFSPAHS